MSNTPSSRTSKHAQSKKSKSRSKHSQSSSRAATPAENRSSSAVGTSPLLHDMGFGTNNEELEAPQNSPPQTQMEVSDGLETPEIPKMKLDEEEVGRADMEEAPMPAVAERGMENGGSEYDAFPGFGHISAPAFEEPVYSTPFSAFDDPEPEEQQPHPQAERRRPYYEADTSMPYEPVESIHAEANVPLAPVMSMQPPRPEPAGFSVLSDLVEHGSGRVLVEVPVRGRERDVTRLEHGPAPVSSPPPLSESPVRSRAPIIVSRNPSTQSSLSRQLQNVHSLLPSSPQLPSLGFANPLANFAAPRISNVTVSGSGFNRPTPTPRSTTDPFVSAKEERRRSTGTFVDRDKDKDRDRARLRMTPHITKVDDSDEEDNLPLSAAAKRTRYPSMTSGHDKVVFASFSTLLSAAPSPSSSLVRRLLFIGYENGLQIWDTTQLGEVQEILNRRLSGAVVGCSVLPPPRPAMNITHVSDSYADRRPLVGILVEEHELSYLLVYSLVTHEVVKKLDFSGASVSSFQASNSFIVVSTCFPNSLHILCARTLNILHTIQSRQLATFSRPITVTNPHGQTEIVYSARQDRPHAVFSLSSRLLAFSSVPPSPDSSLSHIYPRTVIPHSPSIQLGPLNVSQADIGSAALKVGEGLLSGMRVLGGIAVAAARGEQISAGPADVSGGFRKFFSRSAPAATTPGGTTHERKTSSGSARDVDAAGDGSGHLDSRTISSDSTHVTILDLQPLLEDRESGRPERLSAFSVPGSQVVAGLRFSEDGTRISVTPSDGGTVRVYHIRPRTRAVRYSAMSSSLQSLRAKSGAGVSSGIGTNSGTRAGPVRRDSAGSTELQQHDSPITGNDLDPMSILWHSYDLRRGRTSGVIEAVNFSGDCRWVGVSTRKRTIHVFATNPYGGKPDEPSHLDGKVRNASEMQPQSTELRPIVRLRHHGLSSPALRTIPLAFSFLSPHSSSLPVKFLPPNNTFSPASVSSSLPSSSPHRRTQSVSPRLPSRPTNYQDILVFDPSDGSLSLRRLLISTKVGEPNSILSALPIPGATSISLPGMGFGRPSPSPPKVGISASKPAALPDNLPYELDARESVIATWSLSRDAKWSDVKVPLLIEHENQRQRLRVPKAEWLAQAELSTFSRSPHVLPGSIYLSHQFSFYAFDGDYHALIRRSYFDIPAHKIDVRKEVEASNAYTHDYGESFVSAGSSPQSIRYHRSTFDEPLASAILSGLDYRESSSPVIPMLPNGGRHGSFKAAIPIRSVAAGFSDGVSESLGRLSRGIRKVRSPRLRPREEDNTPGPVPLEFDEEDETFVNSQSQSQIADTADGNDNRRQHANMQDNENEGEVEIDIDTMSGSAGGRDSRSISTPSTNNNAPLAGSESEGDGWAEDMGAVEEEERFNEISAAGFMDEEQEMEMPTGIRVPGPFSGPGQKGHYGRKGR